MGASVFYSSPPESETRQSAAAEEEEDEISKLDAELKVSNQSIQMFYIIFLTVTY